MNQFQIEAWVLKIIEQVENGKPDEDSRVELKSTWPEPPKAARRLAAHANSVHGEPILWIIGVDQKGRIVVGADHMELSTWYQQVKAEFDDIAPSMRDLNVNYKDKTVVALLLETERFPFVIKSKDDRLEVPWREGTLTRSAKRSELLKLLIPLQYLPNIEVLSAEAKVEQSNDGERYWSIYVQLYLEPYLDTRLAIPFHRCKASIETQVSHTAVDLEEIRLYPPMYMSEKISKTIEKTPDELLAYGPGKVNFSALKCVTDLSDEIYEQDIQTNLHILPVGAECPSLVAVKLSKTTETRETSILHRWVYK
jgi:hypothetical protein